MAIRDPSCQALQYFAQLRIVVGINADFIYFCWQLSHYHWACYRCRHKCFGHLLFLHSLKMCKKMCPGKLFLHPNLLYQKACHFQGGGKQLRSSLGVTFLCWRRRLCCPWHSSSMFFFITLGVALAAAVARCKALASFPAEACEVCVKSFLAKTAFCLALLCSSMTCSSSYRCAIFWPANKHEEFNCVGWMFGKKAAYLMRTESPISACVCSISDV